MELRELVRQARSYRRFREAEAVDLSVLTRIVDMLRFVPSSVNFQPLRYAVSVSRDVNARLFPCLAWAGLLKDWSGPKPGERPAAYIVIGGDLSRRTHHAVDLGIACQTLFLGLAEAGLAGCMLGNINGPEVHTIVGFPDTLTVLQVMAIGYADETVVMDDLESGGDTAYWRDSQGVHHVPKRRLEDMVLRQFSAEK